MRGPVLVGAILSAERSRGAAVPAARRAVIATGAPTDATSTPDACAPRTLE